MINILQDAPHMSKWTWLNNAAWLLIAGIVYFRGTITWDTNIKRYREDGNDVADATMYEVQKRGPVKFYDPRVLLSATVLSLPAWAAPITSSNVSRILILVSLGAFIGPLTLPTNSSLTLNDLKTPLLFAFKWLFNKVDVYLKGLLIF